MLSQQHYVLGVDRHPWWGDQPAPTLTGELDDPAVIERALGAVPPDVLIHCAGMVDVDACEKNPVKAFESNAELTQRLVRLVPPHCLFVYISTDSLFADDTPFATEATRPRPQTAYAESKWRGELAVQSTTSNHLILRTNFYGWSSGRKFTSAEWMHRALSDCEPVTFFDDLYSTPIYVVDLVERLRVLIQSGHRGIFHLGGRDRVSKYRFGELMAQVAHLPFEHVRKGSLRKAPLVARRPHEMSLNSGRFEQCTGLAVPDCLTGLRHFVANRGIPLSQRHYESLAAIQTAPN
jgi:dTDP-4-dehydrorhamnose reductase